MSYAARALDAAMAVTWRAATAVSEGAVLARCRIGDTTAAAWFRLWRWRYGLSLGGGLVAVAVAASAAVTTSASVRAWVAEQSLVELGLFLLVSTAAVLFAVAAVHERSRLAILQFTNTTGDDTLDGVARGLSRLLESELHRIRRLRTSGALVPDEATTVMRVSTKARTEPAMPDVMNGAPDSGGLSGVGPVELAGVRFSVAALVRLVAGAPTVTGSVSLAGDELRVVSRCAPRPKLTCVTAMQPDTRGAYDTGRAARELAHEIMWQHLGTSAAGGSCQTLAHLVDGLEHHERYRRCHRLDDLRRAERSFLDAIATSPGFAPAYYNLAVCHEARAWDLAARGEPEKASRKAAEAVDAYRQAAMADGSLVSAYVGIARVVYELRLAEHESRHTAVDAARRAVTLARHGGRANSSAHFWLGAALTEAARDERDQRVRRALYRDAVRHARTAVRATLRERWRRPAVEAGTDDHERLCAVTARAAALCGQAYARLAADGVPHTRGAKRYARKAATMLATAAHFAPTFGDARRERGNVLLDLWPSRAWRDLVEALRLDPNDFVSAWRLADLQTDAGVADALRDYAVAGVLVYGGLSSLRDARGEPGRLLEELAGAEGATDTSERQDAWQRMRERAESLGMPRTSLACTVNLAESRRAAHEAAEQAAAANAPAEDASMAREAAPSALELYAEARESLEERRSLGVPSEPARGGSAPRSPYFLPSEPPGLRAVVLEGFVSASLDSVPDLDRERLDDLLAVCKAAIRAWPPYAQAYEALARVHGRRLELDHAIEALNRLLALAPHRAEHVATWLAEVMFEKANGFRSESRQRWLAKAVESYRVALGEVETGSPTPIRQALGEALIELDKAEEAVGELECALATAPGDGHLVVALARAYDKAGRFADAERSFRSGIAAMEQAVTAGHAHAIEHAVALDALAYFHAEQGEEIEEGDRLVAQALDLLARSDLEDDRERDVRAKFMHTRGWLHYRAGRFEQAVADLRLALDLSIDPERRRDLEVAERELRASKQAARNGLVVAARH